MSFRVITGPYDSSAIRKFSLQTALVLALFTTIAVLGIFLRTQTLVIDGARAEAQSYLDLVITTRRWIAAHEGVWIAKRPGDEANEYLLRLGVQAETSTADGTPLVLRNPAAVTHEVSELTSRLDRVTFNMTSLDPVNPKHAPDDWEEVHLWEFEGGLRRAEGVVTVEGVRYFRLMVPLKAEEACLKCHAAQRYVVGDVIGGIGVRVPLAERDSQLRRNAFGLITLWIVVVSSLAFTMLTLVRRMGAGLAKGEEQLRRLAVTDTLTGLSNRAATMERLASEGARASRRSTRLGVIVADIDSFKAVNDTHGHAAGDEVLATVARRMQQSVREYDIVGRVGGEEFLVVAPDVTSEGLQALAERIRATVSEAPIVIEDGTEVVTSISAGAALSEQGEEVEALVQRADRALYAAKADGKNRVRLA